MHELSLMNGGFNVMATNCDDHTKNFSFILKQDSQWELSPAYDICFSYDPDNAWVSQHSLSMNSKHQAISQDDLMIIARSNNIKRADKIIEEIKETVCNWTLYASRAKVSAELTDMISDSLAALKFKG